MSDSYTEADPKVAAEKRAALEKTHKRNEHLAEVGALASGAFALYEHHRTKKDPENAQRHRIESVAGVAALGAAGFAMFEHHQVQTARKEDKANYPEEKKHHGFFG